MGGDGGGERGGKGVRGDGGGERDGKGMGVERRDAWEKQCICIQSD